RHRPGGARAGPAAMRGARRRRAAPRGRAGQHPRTAPLPEPRLRRARALPSDELAPRPRLTGILALWERPVAAISAPSAPFDALHEEHLGPGLQPLEERILVDLPVDGHRALAERFPGARE